MIPALDSVRDNRVIPHWLYLALTQAREIVDKAIELYHPSTIIVLYSGGFDSLVAAHVLHRLGLLLPIFVYSIETYLSADGWRDYVCGVASSFSWKHDIYDNQKGFGQYVQWVTEFGCPFSLSGHKKAYARLKGRAIDAMLKDHKKHDHDKVLFISGIRKAESKERDKLESPINARPGKASWVYANPLFYWTDEQVLAYRLDHDLPENPFYATVGGSGDCQCNWGRFINLEKLRRYSPKLAAGNVAMLDEISRTKHGYGWDGTPEWAKDQMALLDLPDDDEGELRPFLCSTCSRRKSPGYQEAQEERYLQGVLL